MIVVHIFGWLFVVLALAGSVYALLAAWLAGRFAMKDVPPSGNFPPLTILKPLHGDEPLLEANLSSFCLQDYPAPFQLVFGVQDANDSAIAIVENLKRRYPQIDMTLVVDTRRRARNPKIANLLNMEGAIRYETIVLSDSDIAVDHDYLRRVALALSPESVGGVTCLYTGRAGLSLVSQLSAMGVSYHFLPNVIVGLGLKMATPCFGSTIAVKGSVLREIGGFAAFSDQLADDNAIGKAIRSRGHILAIPSFAVRHTATEATWREWLFHELRWMRTIRTVDAPGHAGSVVTHAFPLSLLGLIVTGGAQFAFVATGIALLVRILLKWRLDHVFYHPAGPAWLLPLRDVLSFCVFLTSLFGGSVVWQNERLTVREDGALNSANHGQSVRK